jgi:LemA protein
LELLIVLLVLLAITVVWFYNRLVRLRNTVAEAWAGIDVQLQRRHELVPNLVATVKGYLRHEAEVLESVTLERSALPDHVAELSGQETRLSRALGRLFALAEDYPELRASESLGQLHDSLVEVEEQLQYARRYFNGAVRDHNNAVESFPSNLVARTFDFRPAEFFEIELASQRQAPRVDLDAVSADGA